MSHEGLSVRQRVFGLTDSYRGGTPGGVCGDRGTHSRRGRGELAFTVGASVAVPGLPAHIWHICASYSARVIASYRNFGMLDSSFLSGMKFFLSGMKFPEDASEAGQPRCVDPDLKETPMSKQQIVPDMEVIGADGVYVGTVDAIIDGRIKLTKRDSGEGSHEGHNHFIDLGLVAIVADKQVRLSANAAVAVTFEEEESRKPV